MLARRQGVGRGLLVAACLLAACSDGEGSAASDTTASTAEATTTTARPTTTTAPYAPVAPFTAVVSAWAPGGLDAAFVAAVPTLPGVVGATVVQGDRLMLADGAPPGMGIPLDALAIDPATYPSFVAGEFQAVLARLGPGEAVLGASGASLRGLDAGGTLTLVDGTRLTVVGVLPDEAVAGAEVVVRRGAVATIDTDRYVLVAHNGDLQAVAGALRDAYPAIRPLRVRERGEVRYLRHGDGVRTDAEVKLAFGELAFLEGPTRDFAAWDTGWSDANVGSIAVPILGTVECHVAILPALRDVLRDVDDLQQAILAEQHLTTTTLPEDPAAPSSEDQRTEPPPPLPDPLLEPDADLGCWNPRLIEPGSGVSRHAYGIAIDLSAPAVTGEHDPRLIDIFEDHGFTWGGEFLTPDPIHFEWVG